MNKKQFLYSSRSCTGIVFLKPGIAMQRSSGKHRNTFL